VTLTATPATGFQFSDWGGDLTPQGGTNPATITMNANKTVTATFVPSGSIAHEETLTGGTSNSTVVKTSTLVSGVAEHLYLAAISTRPRVLVSSVSGLGLTWTLVKSKCAGNNTTGIEVWKALGGPSTDDTVKAILASAATNAVIAVSRYSGVDGSSPIGNILAGNTNGVNANGACSGGVENDAYTFDLMTTVNGSLVYGAVAMKGRTHTPGADYAERAEVQQLGGNLATATAVTVEDKCVASVATAAVNGSFNDVVDWAVVAVEIKPQVALGKQGAIRDDENLAATSSAYQLYQNYPNPFNPTTSISYILPEAKHVSLKIYNLTGQEVATLVNGHQERGRHEVLFDAASLPSGNYFAVLHAGGETRVRRILLTK
jgi:hypothetical protein